MGGGEQTIVEGLVVRLLALLAGRGLAWPGVRQYPAEARRGRSLTRRIGTLGWIALTAGVTAAVTVTVTKLLS